MRSATLALAAALAAIATATTFPAAAADRGAPRGKSPSQLACERACHDDHRWWVEQCIEYHDPLELLPSARGQCVDAGAERLAGCLESCR